MDTMGLFLLALLLVIVIPLAEGMLLALVLREVHIRHPLPLGGTIGVRKTVKSDAVAAEEGEISAASAEDAEPPTAETLTGESTAVPTTEAQTAPPVETSPFDGAKNIPEQLPINDVLEAMTSEVAPAIPNDFERFIEESAQSNDEVISGLRTGGDEMDHDDLLALEEALPGTKIDFSQELETPAQEDDPVSPMAKELLGEQFDFEALERQTDQFKQSFQPSALDVREDESGMVQVSSPFMSATPQLAEFSMPQMVLPAFSSDWIQESGNHGVPIEGELSQFFYTEESRPMFVRKRKTAETS